MEKGNYIFLITENTMCDNCDKLGGCTLVYFYFFNRCDLCQDISWMLNLQCLQTTKVSFQMLFTFVEHFVKYLFNNKLSLKNP